MPAQQPVRQGRVAAVQQYRPTLASSGRSVEARPIAGGSGTETTLPPTLVAIWPSGSCRWGGKPRYRLSGHAPESGEAAGEAELHPGRDHTSFLWLTRWSAVVVTVYAFWRGARAFVCGRRVRVAGRGGVGGVADLAGEGGQPGPSSGRGTRGRGWSCPASRARSGTRSDPGEFIAAGCAGSPGRTGACPGCAGGGAAN
jgi:hypothetical protein